MTIAHDLIDSHHHLWRLSRGEYRWLTEPANRLRMAPILRDFEAPEFRTILARHAFGRSVLVQAEQTDNETGYLFEVARENDFIAGIVGWVDLAAPDAADRIARYASDPLFKGIRAWMLAKPDVDWILGDALTSAIRATIQHTLCFDALLGPANLPSFIRLMDRHPDLRVVVCHAGKPRISDWTPGDRDFRDWQHQLGLLASRGCYVKLSGIVTDSGDHWQPQDVRPYVNAVLEAFGPSRTMWGSDWPVINRAGGYDKWLGCVQALTAHLSDDERGAILGGTAAAFYRLT